ncbi:MAG TPA: YbhB/YbcL family Raf kinase inhibitor-like protein [Methanocorpusculum sp.]|nr:YbhB/YbcL family Raf kinase inhibitor-like protein [Methanocorpusculum sp.]HJJ53302.1 YbhB/YbcL family Raf kinase inhibitor-like protein [Methanocorpusculum sp.]
MEKITIHVGKHSLTASSTLNGGNISPKIDLQGVPKDIQYVAMIVQNKSGAETNKCIWSIWNIPSVGYIPPGYEAGAAPKFPFPAVQGVNDFGEHAWHGPSPGLGVMDRLLFQVFGRNEPLTISADSKMDEVIEALRDGKTIAHGSLEVTYHG